MSFELSSSDDDEHPNTGCNYDPADPRGWYKDEDTKEFRRRAWLYMAHEAQRMADFFLAEGGHRAIAIADPEEIDREVTDAAWDAYQAWGRVHRLLCEKRASTLPQDGRNEVHVDDDPTPGDIGDIPPELDRRRTR